MTFYRWRTIGKTRYLYEETRWREGKKVRSRSRVVGRVGEGAALVGSALLGNPLIGAVALPFEIGYDLISGNRVEQLKEYLATKDGRPGMPAAAWAEAKFSNVDRQRAFDAIFKSSGKSHEELLASARTPSAEYVAQYGDPFNESSYPAHDHPTDEEEVMHGQWNDNEAAQRDEDEQASNEVDGGAPGGDQGAPDGQDADAGEG